MKVQLLSPAGEIHRNHSGIFKRSLRYAPLTLTTLAALVPKELNAEVIIQDEGVEPLARPRTDRRPGGYYATK